MGLQPLFQQGYIVRKTRILEFLDLLEGGPGQTAGCFGLGGLKSKKVAKTKGTVQLFRSQRRRFRVPSQGPRRS